MRNRMERPGKAIQSCVSGSLVVTLAAVGMVLTASTGARAQTGVTKVNATQGLFDASFGTRDFVVSAADMAGGSAVSLVTIAIDFEKFDGETFGVNGNDGFPFYNEIFFTLTNPAGVTTRLIDLDSFGDDGPGFRGVITFDDFASTVVNADPDNPTAGIFRPTGPGTMADLNTANGVGVWTLHIEDIAPADHLGFYSATLNLNGGAATAAVPELSTLGLAGMGALALVGAVARRRKTNAAA